MAVFVTKQSGTLFSYHLYQLLCVDLLFVKCKDVRQRGKHNSLLADQLLGQVGTVKGLVVGVHGKRQVTHVLPLRLPHVFQGVPAHTMTGPFSNNRCSLSNIMFLRKRPNIQTLIPTCPSGHTCTDNDWSLQQQSLLPQKYKKNYVKCQNLTQVFTHTDCNISFTPYLHRQ